MTEFITSGPSSRERLKRLGMEVITRCKDCEYSNYDPQWGFHQKITCRYMSCDCGDTEVEPMDYCSWGIPRVS